MWFRNLQLYRLPTNWNADKWAMTAERLAEQLARLSFQPCGSQDPLSFGWAPVLPEGGLVHSVAGQWLIALGVEQRLLPSSVVKQEVAERAEAVELQQGYRPGRKQLSEIKDAVLQELLPRAFTRRRRSFAWIDPQGGWLGVDAASRSAAENMLDALHKALDDLPLKLLNTRNSPSAAMTQWLLEGEAPGAFSIDQDCELRSLAEEKSAVRYVSHTLDGKDVRDHLTSGKQVTKLALTFDDRVSLILTDKLEVKRLQFLDVIKESNQGQAGDAVSAEEQFDADFALMTGELRRLIPALIEALGGEEETV